MNEISSQIVLEPSDWSADELIPFGKYILLDRINSGATAAVYRANVRGEAGFERLVAIKRILPHMAGDRDFVDTFVREAKTVARLAHAGICPIYELGKVGESLYMAVEYIQGKDLGQIMRKLARRDETMPPLIAAWIAARLCDALDYAHNLKNSKGARSGMIHRDLSPSNILVSYEGQVKLIDFGLARAVGRAQSTNVDALKKKLSYMSPEMVKGRRVDARSDIFGLGICLYEMVTGRRLFAAQNDIETLKLVGRASVPPPSAVVDDAPDELELVIMHSLEREPEDRFQTAADVGEALNAYLQKTDPSFNSQRLSDWMHELFAEDIDEEQQRIKQLLDASKDPELIKQRRVFFASPSGAAARARAEVERRLSTEPPPAHFGYGTAVPKSAKLPAETAAAAQGATFEEEPTSFYDPERTAAAPPDAAARAFEEEPTSFYDEPKRAEEDTDANGFDDEPTHFVPGAKAPVVETSSTGGFDEEPTEIYFNKEEGVGIQELLDEINDVERPAPLNRPIVAPELAMPMPAPGPASGRPVASMRPQPSVPVAPPATWTEGMADYEINPARRASVWPIALSVLLLGAIGVLIVKTPVGVALGLRPAPAGTVDVRTQPATAAEVRLDEVYRGRAPLRLQGVQPGVRRLEIRAAGFIPVERAVYVQNGVSTVVEIALSEEHPVQSAPAQPAPTEPPGGSSQSGAPAKPQAAASSPSSHHHHDHASSHRGEGDSMGPAPSAAAPAAVPNAAPRVLPGTPGTLGISTVPWSLIYIDGRDTGRSTPLLGYMIPPGPHEVRLQTANGQVFVERIEVQPGQNVQINRRFQ